MNTQNLTIKKARELLDKKEISVKELAEAYLKNIKSKNPTINAFLEVYDDVLAQAENAQKCIDTGKTSELTGIPLAIKDNILIKGKKASAASKILENYTATYTATAAQKLLDQNAIFLGRTNMDEFAMGSSTENSAFGVTKNPWDGTRVAGGSSGGSSAAVAAEMALGALGSDTGGSVREPASFCGVVGLKPTYGSVSRYGLIAMGSSLDVIGPIANTVSDAEMIFDAIKGADKYDSTSITPTNPPLKLRGGQRGVIGVPYHILDTEGISQDVRKNFDESVEKFKTLGFDIEDVKLPNIGKSLAVYYIIMPAEVSSNLARFDGMRYGLSLDAENLLDVYKKSRGQGFGKETRRRIMLGTYVLSSGYYDAYYNKAMIARRVIGDELGEVFKKVDVILTPTTPAPAWVIGEKTSPLENYLADIFTVAANIVGGPALSLPSGLSAIGGVKLPLGIQLMAPHKHENVLFELGKKFLGEN